ncbi:maleylacetate reductase [Paracoccus litorisediminis]|uniref:Iron-containing alcohol dehydrogenase n=1 Tax=Paracoccus litorisediminis TaxID=2006130 RepID=A0A844HN82_9RHOB|nr:maleylacetate reductase [Paracoccus litorisediminis]MTH61326.1 iron-containing alcohol dehydrogenase [Paracoccus litorisediminis]
MMTSRDFVYTGHPARVIFGSGTTARLPQEMQRLGAQRALILSTPQQESQAQAVAELLGPAAVGLFPGAVMHTPVEVSEHAAAMARRVMADVVVAIGGGSTTGLGKAIALRTDLPQIVIPTTYAGSEMTPILGETSDGQKRTQTTAKVLPEVVIYDVDHTLGLPSELSGTSGINAIAHAVEALYARETNPIITALALEAIGSLARALPVIAQDPGQREARADALYGAWLCGICLGSVGMALHHKLCHTLGGTFDLPHAECHTLILPHALAYNAPAIPEVMARLTTVLGQDPARALFDLGREVRAPASLAQLGMPADGIGRAVDLALANPYWNPRPLERDALTALITRAHQGQPPVV